MKGKGKMNKNELEKALSMVNAAAEKTIIEESLYKLFSIIFEGLNIQSFKLNGIEDVSPSWESLFSFSYNIHYGNYSIKFQKKIPENYWYVECETFAKKQGFFFKTNYFRTGFYLINIKTLKVMIMKKDFIIKDEVLSDPEFIINDDGSSNYEVIYRKINEKKQKEELLEAEQKAVIIEKENREKVQNEEKERKQKNHIRESLTVYESLKMTYIIEIDYTYSKDIEEIVKKLLFEYEITYIEIENNYIYQNNEIQIKIIIPVEYKYPFAKTFEYYKTIKERLDSVFGGKEIETNFNKKIFACVNECKEYMKKRKEGDKVLQKIKEEIDKARKIESQISEINYATQNDIQNDEEDFKSGSDNNLEDYLDEIVNEKNTVIV